VIFNIIILNILNCCASTKIIFTLQSNFLNMKNCVFICLVLLLLSCKNTQQKNVEATDENAKAIIEFKEELFDFGEVKQGEKVLYAFKFKNIGNADLVITDVIPSCGCTVPAYNKEPIAPGDSGKIKVMFNTRGRHGKQFKTVKVSSNAENSNITLSFKAIIIE